MFGSSCEGCRRRGPLLCDACLRATSIAGEVKRPPHVARLLCPWSYEAAVRSLILRLKLRGVDDAARPLANGLIAAVHRGGMRARVLTWVPGRPRDIRRRGFDHAELLARLVSRELGMDCRPLLERCGTQADQAGLSARQRSENLRGAFRGRAATGPVALVDDVITTGSTLAACARALRTAGATSIEALVVAASN